MYQKTTSRLAASLHSALLGLAVLGLSAGAAQAQTAYGLFNAASNGPRLVTFQATAPGTFTANVLITGLGTGQTLVGLDSRPNTGQLFALGYTAGAAQAQLYTLDPTTGTLTAVGSVLPLNLGTNTNRIGFDFNPTVDRIRVTGSNNSNFRLNPANGALAATDGTLAYAATDTNAAQTPGVGAVAYTNSYIGATATTLFDIDEANARLALQNPPNNGTLNTVGSLGPVAGTPFSTDLDIYFNPANQSSQAYLVVATNATSFTNTLYTLNLTTGATTLVGTLGAVPGGGSAALTDIALQITRPALAPVVGNLAYVLAGSNLLTFDTALPRTIRTSVAYTGVDATQTLVGLDIRPATNTLYALGYNTTAQTYTLYSLNALSGVATPVNATPIALALGTGKVSFDFNPTVDRIRVVGPNRNNFRLNPNDGTIAATDTPLAYASGDANAAATPNISAVAYTNSVAGATATTTTLYDYDLGLGILAIQNPPNNGTLNTVGATGLSLNATIPGLDMDIYSPVAGTNTAYIVANPSASPTPTTVLYTLNLTTGNATLVGEIGFNIAARDLAVAGPAGVVTAVRERSDLATAFSLYPNPSRGTTDVAFTLVRAGLVELAVFDNLGRRVTTVPGVARPAGPGTLRWTAGAAKPGLYIVRLVVDGQPAATRQLVME